ncbi:hypothetical protein KP07_05295, partial [Candidatus Liberibacter solanacearum]
MVELNYKKPSVESIAPNQDAVRDAVNPARGLQDVSVAIEQATKTLETLRRATVFADANTQFTRVSAEADKSFMDYTNSLDTRNTPQAGDKINAYVEGTLRKNYDNFISTIPNREVRQHFQAQVEHDLRHYQKKGLEIQIGAQRLSLTENVNIVMGNGTASVLQDPSNENYFRQVNNITDHINSLPISLVDKQTYINQAQKDLNINQVSGVYKKNPRIFENFITASYKGGSPPKDPTSIADIADSASERSLEINADVSKAIGLAGWERLDDTLRRSLLDRLISKDNCINTKLRDATKKRVRLIEANLDKGNVLKDSDLIPLEDYTQAYGVEQGAELYELQQFKSAIAPEVARIKLMSTTEAKELLQKVETHGSDPTLSLENTTKIARYYQMLSKAHTESMQKLHQDPIKWGIEHKQIDPLRFDTAENFARALVQRSSFVKKIKETHGIASQHLSSTEEKQFKDQLMKLPSSETVAMIQGAYNTLSDSDKESVLSSFAKIKDNALSAVVQLSSEFADEANVAAGSIIVGTKNKLDIEQQYKAHPQSDNKAFDTHYNPIIAKH